MESIRIIHAQSRSDSFDERIIFTQEGDAAVDFFSSGFDIISDVTHQMNMPFGFPMEYTFKREVL